MVLAMYLVCGNHKMLGFPQVLSLNQEAIHDLYIPYSLVSRPLSAFFTCRKEMRGGLVSKVT